MSRPAGGRPRASSGGCPAAHRSRAASASAYISRSRTARLVIVVSLAPRPSAYETDRAEGAITPRRRLYEAFREGVCQSHGRQCCCVTVVAVLRCSRPQAAKREQRHHAEYRAEHHVHVDPPRHHDAEPAPAHTCGLAQQPGLCVGSVACQRREPPGLARRPKVERLSTAEN